MGRKTASSLLVILFAFTGTLRAALPGPLDLIPGDAAVGILIRSLDDLKEKGDKLITDSKAKVPGRFSDAFTFLVNILGVNRGLDTKQAGGLIVAGAEFADGLGVFNDIDRRIVVVLPFTKLDDMAANFGIEKMKLDTLTEGKGMNFGTHFYAKGSHIYFGNNPKAVSAVAKGKPVADQFAGARKQSLAEADVLLLVNFDASRADWKRGVADLENSIQTENAAEREVLKKLVGAMTSFKFGAATLKIDDGLGVRFLLSHPKEEGKKFLAELGTGADRSGLAGLPEGNVIAAQALKGDGAKNALLVKALLDYFLRSFVDTKQLIGAADRVNYVNVFTDVWQRLQGTRVAVYQNDDDRKQGLFSVVAILDAEKAEQFLDNLRLLAQFADSSVLKRPEEKEDPVKVIEKLIRDLDDNEFFVRHAATTKLELLGEPALPYLEKLIASKATLEVTTRAERLAEGMRKTAAERRKELLSKELSRPVRPSFTVVPKAEMRNGQPVHIVLVKLREQDAALTVQLRQLFGPDWDRIRLATHGKNIVALLGSDAALLDATLVNLKDSKPGLAGMKSLGGFQKHGDPARQFEFHVSAQRAAALLAAEGPVRLSGLTSISLAVDTEHVQLDLWMPPVELGAVLKENWW